MDKTLLSAGWPGTQRECWDKGVHHHLWTSPCDGFNHQCQRDSYTSQNMPLAPISKFLPGFIPHSNLFVQAVTTLKAHPNYIQLTASVLSWHFSLNTLACPLATELLTTQHSTCAYLLMY